MSLLGLVECLGGNSHDEGIFGIYIVYFFNSKFHMGFMAQTIIENNTVAIL